MSTETWEEKRREEVGDERTTRGASHASGKSRAVMADRQVRDGVVCGAVGGDRGSSSKSASSELAKIATRKGGWSFSMAGDGWVATIWRGRGGIATTAWIFSTARTTHLLIPLP